MSSKAILELNGIFAVYKPVGETSAKVVSRVKQSLLGSLSKRYLSSSYVK